MDTPCVWTLDESWLAKSPVWPSLDPTQRDQVSRMAVEFLWAWTGRQFGQCPAVLRPCPAGTGAEGVRHRPRYDSAVLPMHHTGSPWLPVYLDSATYNLWCGTCSGACACIDHPAIRLPRVVTKVEAVYISGQPLSPESYSFIGGVLYRTDGETWPDWQDITAPEGSVEAWEIHVLYGLEVPVGGQLAAAVLADQFARALTGVEGCQLPQRIRSITREGVTAMALDDFSDLHRGGTGIWLIDSWVASVSQSPRTPRVYSVDTAPSGRSIYRVR